MTKLTLWRWGILPPPEFKNNYIQCMVRQETVTKYIAEHKPMTVLSPCKTFLKFDF